ncbi:hypothetical protein LAZ67_9001813 [Cordylochernes scorpioides]|uniref:Peptidase M14 domain-containing protein n=1 Tax=Cordylochernes scorpioides TaxID=51811 RepID=A0ABY6KTD9_9ARAC|nr:hypothetical protein LAZ67_9001813 [Cordylochernes scorpioides]
MHVEAARARLVYDFPYYPGLRALSRHVGLTDRGEEKGNAQPMWGPEGHFIDDPCKQDSMTEAPVVNGASLWMLLLLALHLDDPVNPLKDAMRGLAVPRTEKVIIDNSCATRTFFHRLEHADKIHREILDTPRQQAPTMSHGNHGKKKDPIDKVKSFSFTTTLGRMLHKSSKPPFKSSNGKFYSTRRTTFDDEENLKTWLNNFFDASPGEFWRNGIKQTSRTLGGGLRVDRILSQKSRQDDHNEGDHNGEDRRVTIDEIMIRLPPGIEIGRSWIGTIMSDVLNFRKVCARWVPRLLSENHKQQRMEAARGFLEMHRRDGDQLFSRIVTGDESWVHHSTPETKRQSMVWKKPEESAPKKAKAVGRELMLHLIEHLISSYRAGDPEIKRLMDSTRLHIMPSLNPDGFEQSRPDQCVGVNGRMPAGDAGMGRREFCELASRPARAPGAARALFEHRLM